MNRTTVALQKAWDELLKPESYVKGEEFENYVRKTLFPGSRYELLSRTHGYAVNKEDFVASSKEPDFRFRCRSNNIEFHVEAKYRADFYRGMMDWCKGYQLKRYRSIDKKTPVVIAIGTGGTPAYPREVFLVRVRHIKYTGLYPSFLKKYKTAPRCVHENALAGLLS